MRSESKAFMVSDNDVPAVGQTRNSKAVYYLGNPRAKKRLLILGNSITRHGPLDIIGWYGDFGMAASKAENDYVHRLAAKLFEHEDIFIMVRHLSDWERNYSDKELTASLEEERAFGADEIIFNLGENVLPLNDEEKPKFKHALYDLFAQINPEGAKIYFATCFWKNESVDEIIRAVAGELKMPVTELSDLGADERYMAVGLFEHNGVTHHPGDLGMACIADRLYREMRG